MSTTKHEGAAPQDAAGPAAAGSDPARGVTLDLFDALPLPADAPAEAARPARGRRAAPLRQPAAPSLSVPMAPPAAPEAGPGLEQALAGLPAEQLQGVVGRVATAIVRSAEFQFALRAQLYTLVAPAVAEALREGLSQDAVRNSLREGFGGATTGPATPSARTVSAPAMPGGPAVASAAPPPEPFVTAAANAVLLVGYEPAAASAHKAALAAAGYEGVIAEVGPNDAALPADAWRCAIACLPDEVMEHVESLVSRHPFQQVLRVSATARRLAEAVELALPLAGDGHAAGGPD